MRTFVIIITCTIRSSDPVFPWLFQRWLWQAQGMKTTLHAVDRNPLKRRECENVSIFRAGFVLTTIGPPFPFFRPSRLECARSPFGRSGPMHKLVSGQVSVGAMYSVLLSSSRPSTHSFSTPTALMYKHRILSGLFEKSILTLYFARALPLYPTIGDRRPTGDLSCQ